MKPNIYLIGVGYYTEVIIELAQDCGFEVKGLYHYNEERVGDIVLGVEVIGSTNALFLQDIKNKNFGVTMGDNLLRENLANKIRGLGGLTPNLIHPTVILSPSIKIGVGCFLHANALLLTKSEIGNDCNISPNSMVSHHAMLGNACFLAPFSVVGAYSVIGNRVLFGINSIILPTKLVLGDDCVVGAKANVTKSFVAKTTLVGNPAKPLK